MRIEVKCCRESFKKFLAQLNRDKGCPYQEIYSIPCINHHTCMSCNTDNIKFTETDDYIFELKVACTHEERKKLIRNLAGASECVFLRVPEVNCTSCGDCADCIEGLIDWELIPEEAVNPCVYAVSEPEPFAVSFKGKFWNYCKFIKNLSEKYENGEPRCPFYTLDRVECDDSSDCEDCIASKIKYTAGRNKHSEVTVSCTEEEKELFVKKLDKYDGCVLHEAGFECTSKYLCTDCLKETFQWDIQEETGEEV